MKKIFTCLLFICCATVAYTQLLPDSVITKYRSAKTDEEKGHCLLLYLFATSSNDSITIAHRLELSLWFKKQNDEVGADYTELHLSNILSYKGDYPAALNLAFPALSRFEKRKDTYGITCTNNIIGNAYVVAKNYEQAIDYLKKSIPFITSWRIKERLSSIYGALGWAYGAAGMPDSGMAYAQKAINIDMELKDSARLMGSVSDLGENYMAAKEYDIAIPFLRKSVTYIPIKKLSLLDWNLAYLKNDFGQAFLAIKQYDSANYYAHQAIQISTIARASDQTIRAYEYLYKSFEETNRQDSVNKYFRLAMTAKDSLFSLEKTRNMEALSFREQLHQQELAAEKIKAEEGRKQNIQFALIALGIVSFIILFLLLSRSFITNIRLIKFLGILALLLVFEFINILAHSYLEQLTNNSQILILLLLVGIAALLIPLHHRMEKWTITKVVEKNKKVRLAAAKRTIDKLEPKVKSTVEPEG